MDGEIRRRTKEEIQFTHGQRKANESTKGKNVHIDREKPMTVPREKFTLGQRKANESTKGKNVHMDREKRMTVPREKMYTWTEKSE